MTTNTTDLYRRFIQALPSSCSLGQVKISLFFNCLSTHWDDIIYGINIDPFEGIQDSLAFRIPYGYWKYQSLLVELGLWTPIFSGIPDSLSCFWIPNPRIPDSSSKIIPDSKIQNSVIPVFGSLT